MADNREKIEISQEAKCVIENLKTRWSCRVFKDTPVPRQVIETLLDAANYAPSPKNCQPWEFIALSGEPLSRFHQAIGQWLPEKEYAGTRKEELGKLLPDGDYYTSVPAVLLKRQKLFLSRLSEQLEQFGVKLKDVYKNTFYFHYAPAVILVIGDKVIRDRHGLEVHQALAAAVQNMLLAAHALGYGTCWIGDVLRFGSRLNAYFEMDDKKEVVAGVAVGLPAISLNQASESIRASVSEEPSELKMDRVAKLPVTDMVRFLGF